MHLAIFIRRLEIAHSIICLPGTVTTEHINILQAPCSCQIDSSSCGLHVLCLCDAVMAQPSCVLSQKVITLGDVMKQLHQQIARRIILSDY